MSENISENTTAVPNWRFSYNYRHAGRISSIGACIGDLGGPDPATIPLSAAPPGASIEYPNDTTTAPTQKAVAAPCLLEPTGFDLGGSEPLGL